MQTNILIRDNKAGAMAEEDGSKPKYEVEEISIKTRVQKILDLSTTRSDLSIGLSYCKNRTKNNFTTLILTVSFQLRFLNY